MKSLDEIFGNKSSDQNNIRPLSIGENFPVNGNISNEGTHYLFCFLSLYCFDCVELLTHLAEINKRFYGEVTLYTDATLEENLEIKDHFDYEFMVLSYTKEELASLYHVYLTPYVFILDSKFSIIKACNIKDANDLLDVLELEGLVLSEKKTS
ncbi:hypothetical protein [Paenibacillus donghaensis]|uniref:Alkyl hydroperoxide reductase subunit C/ Thiol specific antioxidant domain-containing protein n=1 Tax=Paenibacillus donghaensis TaxID=414771 RepID=A0A2Z2K4U8_9BACL|nr:hypothetical protein [Paenibacillus donghaensis]ASA19467.1 hypothetical protein B9T62_00525 [Paenibacillus donghaensis]